MSALDPEPVGWCSLTLERPQPVCQVETLSQVPSRVCGCSWLFVHLCCGRGTQVNWELGEDSAGVGSHLSLWLEPRLGLVSRSGLIMAKLPLSVHILSPGRGPWLLGGCRRALGRVGTVEPSQLCQPQGN